MARLWSRLYGKSSTGKIKVWTIKVEDNKDGTADIITEYGREDGEMLKASVVIEAGKNIGRSNETTPYQQACLEANAKWLKKKDKKYVLHRADLDNAESIILPMLAHNFKKRGKDIEWPALIQPKLNGIRCLAKKVSNYAIEYTSREGKSFNTLDHLTEPLLKVMQTRDILDGELFTKILTFQEIVSAVKREKTINSDIELIEFWVYDCISDGPFIDRVGHLRKVLVNSGPIVPVPTRLINSEARMIKMHKKLVAAGYEGTIIRNCNGAYKKDYRSSDLQKYKDFIDEEFVIVGGKQGVGKDAGAITFTCVTEERKEFDCRPRGTYEQRRAWWNKMHNLIGKKLTVRYQARSDANIPLFPVGISVRDYE